MDVHLRDLRYFVAVAEELHFTRAAERLFISQPALSKQIGALERQLRTTLFDRGGRSVTLTPAAEALLVPARELLAAWDEADRAVVEATAEHAAVLRIGFSTSIGRGLLPGIRREFERARPAWRLQLRQVDWSDPTGGLADASSDLAFVWLPVPSAHELSELVLAEEPRHVALPVGHALASRDELAFAELLDEPFLALPPEAGALRDYWLATDARDGRPVRIGGVVGNAEETFEAVLAGIGVVLLSVGNAEIYRRPGVTTVPVDGISPSRLALLWRTADRRPAVLDFVAAARRSAPAVSDADV